MVLSEIEAEQAYIDKAHDRLEAMREAARSVASEVMAQGAGGTFAARVERDIRVELSSRRLAHLDIGDAAVAFGRLDANDGQRYYIGRLGVFDEDGEPLVVDWRAPVAEPFYRATPAQPLGVSRRRHFLFRGRRLVRIEDELLDRDELGDGLVLVGEAALLAALEHTRTGRMGDIVATIQAEQDAIIRSELAGALVVQGGPGTGKTAVALHRAAYLLFSHRARLEREGVLLVGPNTVFLRYVEQVLPSLGEQAAALATPADLYAGATVPKAIEDHETAALKGDLRMARLLERAVATRQRGLRQPLRLAYGAHELRVSPETTRAIAAAARGRRGSHNARRAFVERRLSRALAAAWREAETRAARHGRRAAVEEAEVRRVAEELETRLGRLPETAEALERMWPVLTPEQLLHDLFGALPLLRRAGEGLYSGTELARLARPRSASLSEVAWTDADIALLDEAAVLLGPVGDARRRRPRRRRGSHDGPSEAETWMLERALADRAPECPRCGSSLTWSGGARPWSCDQPSCQSSWRTAQVMSDGEQDAFEQVRARVSSFFDGPAEAPTPKGARVWGHILVDEAQGVTPMQWRSIARRSLSGSFTIVGDLGQATGANAPRTWDDVLDLLPGRAPGRITQLSVNYRTPAEVMELAARVLAEAAPELAAPRSVRSGGEEPRFSQSDGPALLDEIAAAVAEAGAAVGDGKVAVIAPDRYAESVALHLDAPLALGGAMAPGAARHLLDAQVAVFTVDAARGLEFDAVLIVEPVDLVAEHTQGLKALYVALSRTTRRLQVLSSKGLPESLRQFAQELSSAQR